MTTPTTLGLRPEDGDKLLKSMAVLERRQEVEVDRMRTVEKRVDACEHRATAFEARMDACDSRWKEIERKELEESIRLEARQQLLDDLKKDGKIGEDTIIQNGGRTINSSLAGLIDKLDSRTLLQLTAMVVIIIGMLVGGATVVNSLVNKAVDTALVVLPEPSLEMLPVPQ